MKNIIRKCKKNKLNIVTIFFLIIVFCIYIIIYCTSGKNLHLSVLLSLTADYVTVASCILVVIQLIAFVKDSRLKEARAKKEYALNLAKEYASCILCNMSFIKNVLNDYCKSNFDQSIEEIVSEIELEKFTESDLKKYSQLNSYSEIFENGKYLLNVDLIQKRIITSQNINLFDNNEIIFSGISESEKKKIINIKFRTIICSTMNILEYFAMSVNQNVAESEMIYVSLHQTFLSFVHYMYPYICLSNKNGEYYYKNIIELYRKWNSQKKEIDNQRNKNIVKANKKSEKESKRSEPLE